MFPNQAHFNTLVASKLLYGLAACWLSTSERRKLDGFQNRCLRSIWGIKPAYFSLVSNQKVLQTIAEKPLTRSLELQQLMLFGKIARKGPGDLMRDVTFCPGSLRPAAERYVRKVGRPRLEWTNGVCKLAETAAGGRLMLDSAVADESVWKRVVEAYANR